MELVPPLFTDFRAILADVWPEVKANGIWEAMYASTVDYSRLTLPFAGIHIETFPPASGWGPANEMFSPVISLYYANKTTGSMTSVIAKAEALRDKLRDPATTLTNGQILRVGAWSWDDSLPPNRYFSENNKSAKAGRVQVQVLIGQPYRDS